MLPRLFQSLIALGLWVDASETAFTLSDCIIRGFAIFVLYGIIDTVFSRSWKSPRVAPTQHADWLPTRHAAQDLPTIPEDQLPPAKEPPPIPRPWLEVEQLPASVIQDAMRAANSRVLTPEQKAYIQGRNNAISEVRAKSEGSVVIAANAQGAVLDVFVQQPQESDHDMP